MDKVEIKNSYLFGAFGASFTNLTRVANLPAKDKFALVKLRKAMVEVADNIKEATEGMTQEQVRDLLEVSSSYDFDRIEMALVVDSLTADDLFHLEPLLKE